MCISMSWMKGVLCLYVNALRAFTNKAQNISVITKAIKGTARKFNGLKSTQHISKHYVVFLFYFRMVVGQDISGSDVDTPEEDIKHHQVLHEFNEDLKSLPPI